MCISCFRAENRTVSHKMYLYLIKPTEWTHIVYINSIKSFVFFKEDEMCLLESGKLF